MILWAIAGLGLGVLFVLVAPFIAGLFPRPVRQTTGDAYLKLTQLLLDKGGIVANEQGGLELATFSLDAKKGADETTLHSETMHFRDELHLVSRLQNRMFGVASGEFGTFVSPMVAEIGELVEKARERGEYAAVNVGSETMMNFHVEVPKQGRFVDLRDAAPILKGDADATSGEQAREYTSKSQEKFHRRVSMSQALIIVGAFVAAAGTVAFIMHFAGSSGSTPDVSMPAIVMAGTVLLVPPRVKEVFADEHPWLGPALIGLVLLAGAGGFLYLGIATGYTLEVAALLGGTVVAAAGTVVGIGLMGPGLPQMLARPFGVIFFTLAQFAYDGSVLVDREGGYEQRCLERDGDGYAVTLSDGKRITVEDGPLFRFGMNPFGMIWEKTEARLAQFDPDDEARKETDRWAATDKQVRGYEHVRPREESVSEDVWLANIHRLRPQLQRAAGSSLAENGREQAMYEDGGEKQLGQVATMAFALLSLMMGALTGWLSMGGLA